MHIKKILEQIFFVVGTFITCLIILAASDLQAHTLIAGKLGLKTSTESSNHPSFAKCQDPELAAREGLILVEEMLAGPKQVARSCFENPQVNSCFPEQFDVPELEKADHSFEELLAEINQRPNQNFFTSAHLTGAI